MGVLTLPPRTAPTYTTHHCGGRGSITQSDDLKVNALPSIMISAIKINCGEGRDGEKELIENFIEIKWRNNNNS